MKIIGIDPGIARTGWGVIRYEKGDCKAVAYGCIETQAKTNTEARLLHIFGALKKIVKDYKPKEAAVEKLFFNTNAKTALSVGEARGVALLALSSQDMRIYQYTPLEIKMAITGYGRAQKCQIEQMTRTILGLKSIPAPDDTADALAVAITHGSIKKPK